MIKKTYNNLARGENSGKKIGLFRILCGIFGAMILAYLAMTLLAQIIPDSNSQTAIIAVIFNTLLWAICAIWICLSKSKLIALLRFLIPSLIFSILLIILF